MQISSENFVKIFCLLTGLLLTKFPVYSLDLSGSEEVTSEEYFNFGEEKCKNISRSAEISKDEHIAKQEGSQAFQRCLTQVVPGIIRNLWGHSPTLSSEYAKDLYKRYYQEYQSVLYQIYVNTIDEVYNLESFDITELPRHIFKTYVEDNVHSLEMTVKLELYLYDKIMQSVETNNKFTQNMIYYMNLIKCDKQFSELSKSLQKRFDKVFLSSTSSLVQFTYKPTFCLRNVLYNTYMYNTQRGYHQTGKLKDIFMWEHSSPVGPEGRWNKEETPHGYRIKGTQLKFYMFVDKERTDVKNQIALWADAEEIPPDCLWQVDFFDNYVFFHQPDNGLAICASTQKYNDKRRYVVAEEKNESDSECLWIAEECV